MNYVPEEIRTIQDAYAEESTGTGGDPDQDTQDRQSDAEVNIYIYK